MTTQNAIFQSIDQELTYNKPLTEAYEDSSSAEMLNQYIVETADTCLNDVVVRDAMVSASYITSHPKGMHPTSIKIPTAAKLSQVVEVFDGTTGGVKRMKAAIPKGTLIESKPVKNRIAVRLEMTHFDADINEGITSLEAERMTKDLCQQFIQEVNEQVFDFVENDTNKDNYLVEDAAVSYPAGGNLAAKGDALLEAIITGKLNSNAFGLRITDFEVVTTTTGYAALSMAAKANGHLSVESFVGTDVGVIDGAEVFAYLLPKRYLAMSFEESNGCVVHVSNHRQAEFQASTVLFEATISLVLNGFIKYNYLTEADAEATVPLIRKVTIAEASAPAVRNVKAK